VLADSIGVGDCLTFVDSMGLGAATVEGVDSSGTDEGFVVSVAATGFKSCSIFALVGWMGSAAVVVEDVDATGTNSDCRSPFADGRFEAKPSSDWVEARLSMSSTMSCSTVRYVFQLISSDRLRGGNNGAAAPAPDGG
jgi:hypothetical protein